MAKEPITNEIKEKNYGGNFPKFNNEISKILYFYLKIKRCLEK